MTSKQIAVFGTLLAASSLLLAARKSNARDQSHQVVRLAELDIDLAQLEAYRKLLQEEIRASVRVEPGVLSLYAVAVKDHPEQIRLFERYASPAAYQAHLQTPHFQRYKQAT